MDDAADVTSLLRQWQSGDRAALDALTPAVYRQLRLIAAGYMQHERAGHTLQPTALVHEAYARMAQQALPQFQNRAHFFAVSAQIMRQVLVDCAREHRAAKRGSGLKEQLDESSGLASPDGGVDDILAIDRALDRLAAFDERKARVIELRYFAGLERQEIADALDVSVGTVKRDLKLGEAWLRLQLGPDVNPALC
jgi:RNA polymerase sigma factor (TIGR02999 family)